MTTTGEHEVVAERIGRYRLLQVLGEGGMGVVHLAEDEDRRRVALKMLRPHVVGDQEARQRLAQEVGSLSRVRSPRVAEIVDADPWAARPYVATRYVAGPTLHQLVRGQGPIPESDLGWFAEALAEALSAVHRVDVLHRDVKPSNVLVEGRSPVLIDFGLARLADDPRLTATGWLLGTPGYLAPEILYGEEPTPAADVHAWAATLVFAATGRAPYGTGPAMAIMDRCRRGEFDLADVPDSIRPLIRDCLHPEPLSRPTLLEIHQHLLERLGLLAPPDAGSASATRTPAPAPAPVETPPALPPPVPSTPTIGTLVLPDEAAVAPPAPPAEKRAETFPKPSTEPGTEPDTDAAPGPMPLAPEPARTGAVRMVLLGVGIFGTALVAFAPYLGAALLLLVACLVRAVSVTKQRHERRRALRGGRARWYDVPFSTVSSPGYLLISLAGSIVLVGWTILTALAVALLLGLAAVPLPLGLVLTGLVVVGCLWWGPASQRVREIGRTAARPVARGSGRAWVALGVGVLGAVVLGSLLTAAGPTWAPAAQAPWATGWLHTVVTALPGR